MSERAIATSEAGRALVNLVAGKDGVAAGAGATDATTLRVTAASDSTQNPISGQAGIDGGTGDATAKTTRVVQATAASASPFGATSVSTISTTIVAANAKRRGCLLHNAGTVTVYVVVGAAATTSGIPLLPGEKLTVGGRGAVAGITASGSATVHYMDEVDA